LICTRTSAAEWDRFYKNFISAKNFSDKFLSWNFGLFGPNNQLI
jgi:hypothetical protein